MKKVRSLVIALLVLAPALSLAFSPKDDPSNDSFKNAPVGPVVTAGPVEDCCTLVRGPNLRLGDQSQSTKLPPSEAPATGAGGADGVQQQQ